MWPPKTDCSFEIYIEKYVDQKSGKSDQFLLKFFI